MPKHPTTFDLYKHPLNIGVLSIGTRKSMKITGLDNEFFVAACGTLNFDSCGTLNIIFGPVHKL